MLTLAKCFAIYAVAVKSCRVNNGVTSGHAAGIAAAAAAGTAIPHSMLPAVFRIDDTTDRGLHSGRIAV